MRTLFAVAAVALVVGGSFAFGQKLRKVAAGPLVYHSRVSSLPEAGMGAESFTLQNASAVDDDPTELFQQVYRYVHTDYVDKVKNDNKLAYGAVRNMVAALDDPKSRFFDPTQYKQLESQLNGSYTGVGANLGVVKQKIKTIDQHRLVVLAPLPGSPAEKAGLQPGDVITHVDGKWVISYDPLLELDRNKGAQMSDADFRKVLVEARKRLISGIASSRAIEILTTNGKDIELTVERAGDAAPLKIKVATAETALAPAEFRPLNGGIGYLRVTQFSDRAADVVRDAVKADGVKKLIVDLRDNSGAPVAGNGPIPPAAEALLGSLTPGGQVGTYLRKGKVQERISVPAGSAPAMKIVVLVNGGTANVAEVVASALKEKAGATLIGSHTFGDSVLQRLVKMRDGSAITLTAGKYLTASGADFTGKGLQPDVALPTGGPVSAGDTAVQRAQAALAGA